MKMKPVQTIILVCVGLMALPLPARAGTIHLSNGKTVEGEVVTRTTSSVRIKTPHGELPIPLDRIAKAEPGAMRKASAMLSAGDHAGARRLAEIQLFWEPTNAEAAGIRDKAAEITATAADKAKAGEMEAAAAAKYEELRARAEKLSEDPLDAAVFAKELSALRSDLQEATQAHVASAMAANFNSLLLSVNSALAQTEKDARDREQARVEMGQKIGAASTMAAKGTDPNAKVLIIGRGGETVDLAGSAIPGAITIFDFYADWCGPCRALAPQLEYLANNNPGIYLRKVDIRDWRSPVAAKYSLRSIPSVWIYGKDGKLLIERLNGIEQIQRAIQAAMK